MLPPLPNPPETYISVLIVADGYNDQLFSFSAVPDKTDTYFTLTQFINTLSGWNRELLKLGMLGLTLFDVTLAHRDNDLGVAPPAPANLLPGTTVSAWFNWQGTPSAPAGTNGVDLSKFDVIYMFGFSVDSFSRDASPKAPPNLSWDGGPYEDQLWAFVQFMQAGGGLFATGDHEDRGASLCGSIPRVRSMRRWWWDSTSSKNAGQDHDPEGPYGTTSYGISYVNNVDVKHSANRKGYTDLGDLCSAPALGPYRLDTVQPGPKGLESVADVYSLVSEKGVPFDRQSDDIPQPLNVLTKHAILAINRNQYLGHLPDHMHEGLVLGHQDPLGNPLIGLTQTFEHGGTTIAEYPKTSKGAQPLPKVVASVSSLTHRTPSSELVHLGALDPDTASTYGAISVYDGTSAGVGRVVTQSSFHHFLDLNLIGDPVTQVSKGTNRVGFTTTAGKTYLSHFELYWVNLTIWLAPAKLKSAILLGALDQARRNASIRIAARADMKDSGGAVHDLGLMVAQHLDSSLSTPMLHDVVHSSFEPEHRAALEEVLSERLGTMPQVADEIRRVFLHGFLGGALLHAMEYSTTTSLQAEIRSLHPKLVAAGLHGAGRSLALSRHHKLIPDLLDKLRSFGTR